MTAAFPRVAPVIAGFRHEALMYVGEDEFLAATVPFVVEGLTAGEPVLAALSARRIAALRAAIGRDSDLVMFADMAELGQNPARIIPAWRDFVDSGPLPGQVRRGIGEPIWQGRSEIELVECQRHEALLNIAFDDGADWWLLCPYDTESLDQSIIDEARRSHPHLWVDGRHAESPLAADEDLASAHLDAPLSEPPGSSRGMLFGSGQVRDVREYVAERVVASGMDSARGFDLLVAVSEIATNSLRHGGGAGYVLVWHDNESVVCEFSDTGVLADPLAGRQIPPPDAEGARGLWLANQLCDLVQIRVFDSGTVIRLHMAVQPPAQRETLSRSRGRRPAS
jgi:anti-sigma regulatory factor (Ser/Thr protein kinase)